MKNYFLLFYILFSFSVVNLQAQIKLAMVDNLYAERFEIYALHEDPDFPDTKSFIGTGQVTLVVNAKTELSNVTNYNGNWVLNAKALTPEENPSKDYLSFGFADYTELQISGSKPTLLFAVEYSKAGVAHIVEMEDPFCKIPNSIDSNPGNELSIATFEDGMELMSYTSNYEPCSPSPLPCELAEMQMAKNGKLKKRPTNGVAKMNSDGTIMAAKTRKNRP